MTIVIEMEGKTVSEATISACEELGVPRSGIEVEVLEAGSKGVLGLGSRSARVRVTVKDSSLSEKGVRSKRVLENILGYLVSAYSVELKETADKIELDIKGTNEEGLLIGKQGEMIKAMESLIGKIAGRISNGGKEKRISIDVSGYKKRRYERVSRLVKETISKVRQSKKPALLETMSASERRVAYLTLKREGGVDYDTKIEGNRKKIIVKPLLKGKD